MKICPVCATEYPDDIKFCQNDGTTLRAAAPARAEDALDTLFLVKLGPTTARMVLDSARRFYDAPAYAAFVVANAYSNLSDRRRFCDWVDSARTRNPGKTAYQTAYQQCP